MTFPTVRSSITSSESVDATTHDVAMPATVNSGDLLVCLFIKDGAGLDGLAWDDTTYGTWTLKEENSAGNDRYRCYVKIADGDEGGGTLAVTTTTAQQSAHITYAIKDWSGLLADVEDAASVNGTDANPDPPNLAPSWGDADNLYLAPACWDKTNTVSVYSLPDNQQYVAGSGAQGVAIACSTDELTGTSQNPGTYTKSASDAWVAHTLVVKPAGVTIRTKLLSDSCDVVDGSPINT